MPVYRCCFKKNKFASWLVLKPRQPVSNKKWLSWFNIYVLTDVIFSFIENADKVTNWSSI